MRVGMRTRRAAVEDGVRESSATRSLQPRFPLLAYFHRRFLFARLRARAKLITRIT